MTPREALEKVRSWARARAMADPRDTSWTEVAQALEPLVLEHEAKAAGVQLDELKARYNL